VSLQCCRPCGVSCNSLSVLRDHKKSRRHKATINGVKEVPRCTPCARPVPEPTTGWAAVTRDWGREWKKGGMLVKAKRAVRCGSRKERISMKRRVTSLTGDLSGPAWAYLSPMLPDNGRCC